MKYEKLQAIPASRFRRITGVKKKTFHTMVELIRHADAKRLHGVGRPAKLTLEDQVLMTLEYLREYRTYLHISVDYGLSESSAYKIIRRTEDTLALSKQFALPKRTHALSENTIEAIIDCTESPIERPKKTAQILLRKEKAPYPQDAVNHRRFFRKDTFHAYCSRSST